MKILHTNFHRGWGGQSNRILNVCRGLTERGHEIWLAAPGGSVLAERGRKAGVRVFDDLTFARGFRPIKIMRDVTALRRLEREHGFDIIHTHGSQDSWAVAYAFMGDRARPIVLRTKHNIFPIRDHFMNRRLYGRWTDGMVCISNAIVEYCAGKPYIDRNNLSLVHSAIDLNAYVGGRGGVIRKQFGLSGRYIVGVTGRLREEKGHRYLLDALPELARSAPELTLLVVGGGSLEGEFKARVAELGLEDRVVFTGFREDVPDVLAALDLFVMPSISEGLGTAIIEAAAARLPIISTRVGGIPDIIEHGVSGLLVEPRDPAALAEAILTLYRDRERATEFGKVAKKFAHENFSTLALVDKTEAVYRDWIARRASA